MDAVECKAKTKGTSWISRLAGLRVQLFLNACSEICKSTVENSGELKYFFASQNVIIHNSFIGRKDFQNHNKPEQW